MAAHPALTLETVHAALEYAADMLGRGVTDEEVLRLSLEEQEIIITDDKDFGELIVRYREQT